MLDLVSSLYFGWKEHVQKDLHVFYVEYNVGSKTSAQLTVNHTYGPLASAHLTIK